MNRNLIDTTKPLDPIPKTKHRLLYYVINYDTLNLIKDCVFTNKQDAIRTCNQLNKIGLHIYRYNWQWKDENEMNEIKRMKIEY